MKTAKKNNAPLVHTVSKALEEVAKKWKADLSDVNVCCKLILEIAKMKKEVADLHAMQMKKHKEDFEYIKDHFLKKTKAGNLALGKIASALKKFRADDIINLAKFLKELGPNKDYSRMYKRLVAEGNKRWSSPSYIVTNVLKGTKQELVSNKTKAYKVMSAAVKKAKKEVAGENPGNRLLSLDGVVSVRDGDHYIAFVSGGNNGHSNWTGYLKCLSTIIGACKHAWLIEVENDCCDDVHYALIGFEV